MTFFKTMYNTRDEVFSGEINTLKSLTQPDQVLSISEMLDRHTRGLPVSGSASYYYDEDYPEDLIDLKDMDLVEIQEARDHYKREVQRMQKELKEREKADKEAFLKKEQSELQLVTKEEAPNEGAQPEGSSSS